MKPWFLFLAGLAVVAIGGGFLVYSDSIRTFANAIAIAEHGQAAVNSGSILNNNPGDLTDANGNLIVYPTLQAGWDALYQQLQSIKDGASNYYDPSMTIIQMAEVYAANWQPWASNVAAVLGVSQNAVIGTLL